MLNTRIRGRGLRASRRTMSWTSMCGVTVSHTRSPACCRTSHRAHLAIVQRHCSPSFPLTACSYFSLPSLFLIYFHLFFFCPRYVIYFFFFFFFLIIRRPPRSPLFPYPPLFRSQDRPLRPGRLAAERAREAPEPRVLEPLSGDRERDEPLADPRVRPRRPSVDGQLPRQRHERSEEHTSELQSRSDLVCRLLLEKK